MSGASLVDWTDAPDFVKWRQWKWERRQAIHRAYKCGAPLDEIAAKTGRSKRATLNIIEMFEKQKTRPCPVVKWLNTGLKSAI